MSEPTHPQPGQVLPLTGHEVTVTVSDSSWDVLALLVDNKLRAVTDESVVFFNQPQLAGITLDTNEIRIDLAAIDPHQRVLCAAAADDVTGPRLTTTLRTDAGAWLVLPGTAEPAQLCWEIYRRNEQWRVRALGQGYDAGLAQLLTSHGIAVDDEPASAPAGIITASQPLPTIVPVVPPSAVMDAARTPPVAPAASPEPFIPEFVPLRPDDRGAAVSRLEAIFEDVARAVRSYGETVAFAGQTRDQKYEQAIADPALRNTPHAVAAQQAADTSYANLLAAGADRLRTDWSHLSMELAQLQDHLPPSLAAWTARAWQQPLRPTDPYRNFVGVRLGTMRPALDVDLPVAVELPEIYGYDAATLIFSDYGVNSPELGAVLRALAVRRLGRLQRVGPTTTHVVGVGGTSAAADALTGLPGLAVHRDIGAALAQIEGLARDSDAVVMAAENGVEDIVLPQPAHIIIDNAPYGWDEVALTELARALSRVIWPITITTDWGDAPIPAALESLFANGQVLKPGYRVVDPWVGLVWKAELDGLSAQQAQPLYRLLATPSATDSSYPHGS